MAPKRKRQQQSTPKIKPTKRVKDGLALLKTEWSAYPWTDDLLKQLTRSFPSWCVELIVLLFGYCNDPRQRSLLVPYIDRINDRRALLSSRYRASKDDHAFSYEAELGEGRFWIIEVYFYLLKRWGRSIWPIELFRYLFECPVSELIKFTLSDTGSIALVQSGHSVRLCGYKRSNDTLYCHLVKCQHGDTNLFGLDFTQIADAPFGGIMHFIDKMVKVLGADAPLMTRERLDDLVSEPLTSEVWRRLIAAGFPPQTIVFCQTMKYLLRHAEMKCARTDCNNPVPMTDSVTLKERLCKSCYSVKGLGAPVSDIADNRRLHFHAYFSAFK